MKTRISIVLLWLCYSLIKGQNNQLTKANYYYEMGANHSAISILNQIDYKTLSKKDKEIYLKTSFYTNYSIINIAKAKQSAHSLWLLQNPLKDTNSIYTAQYYAYLALCYGYDIMADSANYFSAKALKIVWKSTENKLLIDIHQVYKARASAARNTGTEYVSQLLKLGKKHEAHLARKKYITAYFDSALYVCKKQYPKDNIHYANLLRGKANFYIDLYLYYLSIKSKEAKFYFAKNKEFYDQSTAIITTCCGTKNPGIAQNDMLRGLMETYNERPNEALDYLFKAKNVLTTITEKGNHITTNHSLLLTCYTYLNYAYALKYKQTNNLTILKQSVVTNKESIPYFLEYIQQLNLNSKALRDPYYINPFNTITGLYIKLYQHTKNINYIDSAFVFADKSKQLSLLVHKQQSSIFTEVDINKKLMASEHFILFNYTNEFDKISNLKTEIKSDLKTISLTNLQPNIKNNEAIICYADAHPNLGNGLLVAFIITKNTKELIILEDPYYDSEINTTTITQNKLFSLLKDSMPVAFNKFSYSVYNRYFKPINHLLDTTINHLYILPNEGLNTIPFEILTTNENKTNSFLNNNYLLNKYAISYQLSATIGWEENHQTPLNEYSIKFFAPELTKFKLSDLPFCKKMANELNQTYKNCELINPSLVTDFNKSISADNAIIQLYTHSVVDQNNESNSKIYFSDRPIYMSELYKMKVKSPLIFLSSCETDWGWHERYDGQLNFTRALFYAEASSVISSFWKTDDKTTSIITQKFYDYLAQGNNKAIALQKAKLDFIKENPQLNNPMYWTAFKLTGNIDCIKIEKKQYLALLVGLLIILLSSIFLFKRFYKK